MIVLAGGHGEELGEHGGTRQGQALWQELVHVPLLFLARSLVQGSVSLQVRLMDVAQRCGERGIQRQFSLFFKAPYHQDDERAVNDLFKQNALLHEWVETVARSSVRAAV